MPRINQAELRQIITTLKLNMKVLSIETLTKGIRVEFEHGSGVSPITNITKDDLMMTVKIVLAHLIEFPDYYERLDRMEKRADVYWKGKRKQSLFLK
jgi:hypothetical protein